MAAQSFDPSIQPPFDPAKAPVVLLTRPTAQSGRFAASLIARLPGLALVTSSLLEPEFLEVALAKAYRGVILTSETGALTAGRMRAALPDLAYCVGDRTADVARAAGFTARSAGGDAEDLLDLILARPVAPLVHLRGHHSRGDLAKRLSGLGITTDEAITYDQTAQPLTDEATLLLRGEMPVLAPVFSPRTAAILSAECRRIGATAPLTLIVISQSTAEAADWPARIVTARHPDGDSMLEATIDELVAGQGA